MRVPQVRYKVRRMMIAVAIAALMVWLGIMGGRHWRYQKLAASYAYQERLARDLHREAGVTAHVTLFPQGITAPPVTSFAVNLDYYGSMRSKYERAARYPWLPVPPDLPEPQSVYEKPGAHHHD